MRIALWTGRGNRKTMNAKRFALLASLFAFAAVRPAAAQYSRSAYTYVREVSGDAMVVSSSNGEVQVKRNLPISSGDEMKTEDPARVEVALADGNVLHVGGGTRIKFVSLSSQEGSEEDVSAIDLSDGSVILSVMSDDSQTAPRIDTADATVYANEGARVRVNADVRRGTGVVVRAGSAEVKTRSGAYTVRAGNYLLVQGDQEPEIARGSFSRDRFDLWASDRIEQTYESPQSPSSRYVEEEYSADAQTLDGYGDWDYNSTYSSYVWRPNVAVGWTPYSYGSWYYTPIGLSWWSYDPWGWYPYHYGNWFFDIGWNSWCWYPGYVYSPAWCYFAYTPNYFGWCPTGYYGGYYGGHYGGYGGWGRGNVQYAINGRFSTRQVDMRGWNFTNVSNLGTRGRLDVVPGTRVVDRLGNNISVSSRPIVLSQNRGTTTRDALRDYVREAPRAIERTSNPQDSQRLAPVLGRQKDLPESSVQALRERAAVTQRGRLVGPGASEMTARNGLGTVDRGRTTLQTDSRQPQNLDRSPGSSTATERGRTTQGLDRPARPEASSPGTRPSQRADTWRGSQNRDFASRPQVNRQPVDRDLDSADRAPLAERPSGSADWRGRNRQPSTPMNRDGGSRPNAVDRGTRPNTIDRGARDSWRSRPDVPPAQRVIEGSVPRRRTVERDPQDYSQRRGFDERAPSRTVPRDSGRPDAYSPRNAPRYDSSPDRGRSYAPPSAPRGSAPRSIDRAPAPRSAPAPQAAPRSAPAPAPRSAPPSGGGGGHRGRP
jgi:Family of unknown function (DUF6600)/FecR protein